MIGGKFLERYLVQVGFDINKTQMNTMLQQLDVGRMKISSITDGYSSKLSKASLGVISFIAAASAGTIKLLESVASADMETQKLARSMFMNVEATRGMAKAADLLGYSLDNLDEIAANPELTAQFKELYALSQELTAPKELSEQLKLIRSIGLEWKKFLMILNYGVQYVTFFLNKMLGDRLAKIKQYFSNANDWLKSRLPAIAEKVAYFLYHILTIAEALVKVGYNFISWFKGLPAELKATAAALAGVLLIAFGPVSLITASIVFLFLLIDDYMTWARGGQSLFGDIWAKIDPILSSITDSLGGIGEELLNIFNTMLKIFFGNFDFSDTSPLVTMLTLLDDLLNGIEFALESINDLLSNFNIDIVGQLVDNLKDLSKFVPGFAGINGALDMLSLLGIGAGKGDTNTTNKSGTFNFNMPVDISTTASPEETAKVLKGRTFEGIDFVRGAAGLSCDTALLNR